MTVRRMPIPLNVVTPIHYPTWSGSKTPLAGSAVWQSKTWQIGGSYQPQALITDSNADTEYIAANYICDVYVYTDKPGQIEFYGAPSHLPATTYRQLEDTVLVLGGVGTTISGYRVAPGFFYVRLQNYATAQSDLEILVTLKG